MSEGHAPTGQAPEQQSPTQQKADPCDEPQKPDPKEPPTDQKDPTPPKKPEEPCDRKPPVDPWKPRCPDPLPDPCAEEKPDASVPDCVTADVKDPGAQLVALRKQLADEQNEIEQLEQKKTSIADLGERIQSLQKTVDSLKATGDAYREFYNATQVQISEADCFIPTVRCQLDLDDKTKGCITDAMKAVQDKVDQALSDYTRQRGRVKALEAAYARAEWRLKDAKAIHEFLKAGVQDSVKKKRDDLGKLRTLADPKKSKCDAEFYLREMEVLISSARKPPEASDPCYPPKEKDAAFWTGLTLGTYIDCWPPEAYEQAWAEAVVRLNNAEYVEKCRKSGLEAARKRLTDLEKSARESLDRRRDWILKELKDKRCCGSGTGNCA